MELKHLQQELIGKGFQQSADLLANITSGEKLIENISMILGECVSSQTSLADDINILYNQLKHATSFHEQYNTLLIRDLKIILTEILHPSEELTVIFMEDEELKEVMTFYSEALVGNVDAQLELGHFYRSIERDDWAFDWLLYAAKAGNADAQYLLGNYYFMGNVVEQDLEKTYLYYKEAAENGHADALNNYADMYLRGEYVKKDDKRALELFKLAAVQGVPEAMYTLGYMFENGVGTTIDLEKSKDWFMKSANAGDVFAANRLGHEAVENGLGEEAISWYQMAADRGDSYGEFNLGLCYENGIGTTVNVQKAKHWYQKAALKGDNQAKEKLREL